jgi:hypothetical protein
MSQATDLLQAILDTLKDIRINLGSRGPVGSYRSATKSGGWTVAVEGPIDDLQYLTESAMHYGATDGPFGDETGASYDFPTKREAQFFAEWARDLFDTNTSVISVQSGESGGAWEA